jgi:hypothetical protein
MNKRKSILFVALGLLALCLIIFMLPPIQQRFWYRFDQLRIRVFYALKPPEKAVFTPQPTSLASISNATMTALSAGQSYVDSGPYRDKHAAATGYPHAHCHVYPHATPGIDGDRKRAVCRPALRL